MSKIAIVVDSTAGITEDDLKKFENLRMIPLYFSFGEDFYEDGSIGQGQYFGMVDDYFKKNGSLPATSQPSIGRCNELFSELLEEYDHVIYYTLSSKLSGTYQSGVTASNEFDSKVTVVDTLVTSDLQRQMALSAAQGANDGKQLIEILAKSNEQIRNSYAYFVVDDLSHLQRTGRVSATAAVIGSMLKLKPILILKDGLITPVDKVRSITKAHKQVIDKMLSDGLSENDHIGLAHADAFEYAENIEAYLTKKIPNIKINIVELSGVISSHTGPKTIAILTIKDFYN